MDKQFEKWRDRIFAVAVPLFLGYLVYGDAHDGHIDSPILVVLLAAYGSGVAGAIVKKFFGDKGDE